MKHILATAITVIASAGIIIGVIAILAGRKDIRRFHAMRAM
jgi:hypothetical protein